MPLHAKLSLSAYVISGERSANRPKQLRNDAFHVKQVSLPKISSILQKMKIGQNSIYALFARRPWIVLTFSKLINSLSWNFSFYQIHYSSKLYLYQVQVDNQHFFETVWFSFIDNYQVLHEKDLAFYQENLGGDDNKENQAQPRKKPRKVSRDLPFWCDGCNVIVI